MRVHSRCMNPTDGQLLQCYENVFANNCDECGKIIGIDSKDLSYKEKHWHEACFLCNKVRSGNEGDT